jgi:UDP-N-acetylglucosamine 2-epimerase (non-hydrolysing)
MLAVILGTRPEIIKTAPVILEAIRRGIPVGIVHTGQHYSTEMDEIFFQELNLPAPIAHVHVGSHAPARQIGLMMQRLEEVLRDIKPDMVLVQGDTNSVLAGALTAHKMGIPIAHLEAGLRSDDWSMPEEANRILADRLSKWLFCPTEVQRERLRKEGIVYEDVHVVGNTIVDAALHYSKVAYEKSDIAERLGIANRPYALLTLHRPSNVDEAERLDAWIKSITEASRAIGLRVVFPIHPRTKAQLDNAKIKMDEDIFHAIDPVGYLDLLRLQASAELVLTDSGGLQEEACILRVPCITLRPNTERPETLQVGANVLHNHPDKDALEAVMRAAMSVSRHWENPFGDGKTGERVMDILTGSSVQGDD